MFLFPTFAPHKKRGNAQVTENPLSKCNDETTTTPVGRGVAVVFFGLLFIITFNSTRYEKKTEMSGVQMHAGARC